MDKSQGKGVTCEHRGHLLARLRTFQGLLHSLAGLFQLTEDEQERAGIYLDDHDDSRVGEGPPAGGAG